jgi:hypothetical protein
MEHKKEKILDVLKKISDFRFLEDVWVNQKYWDEVLNFGEAVNTLDDYCFFDDVEEGRIILPDLKSQMGLKSFVADLLTYQEPSSPQEMLHDLKWKDLSEKAAILNKQLQAISF